MPLLIGNDKMLVGDFVGDLLEQLLSAIDTIETNHPTWEVGTSTILLRGVLRPFEVNGVGRVVIDINEPSKEAISEIPIPLKRIPEEVEKINE